MSNLQERIQQTLGTTYTVERELGGGGMSRVFVATEPALGRQIVVKVLPPDAAGGVSMERFKREIKLAASLQHPHIVPLLSAGEADGLPYYTMPFVKGESLRERLVKHGELSVKDTLHILRDVASALAYAHGEGVVHRDIKPDNIIVSGGVAVVTDFGVAKAVDAASAHGGDAHAGITSLGIALGTPAYMSPEQAAAEPQVDQRADLYSFGCLAYEMLAGSSPFAGRPLQQMLAAHIAEQPEPIGKRRSAVPPALGVLVMKCLEKRPGDRPQSAGELLTSLDAIATPSGGSEPTTAKGPRYRIRTSFIVAGIVIAAAAITLYRMLTQGGETFEPGQVTTVASTPALEMQPAISPDGKFVAYEAGVPGSFRILVRQIDGERAVPVSESLGAGNQEHPAWSPDGSRIAFEANTALYVVPATGGTPKVLVDSTYGPIASPAWSPDGTRIAFADSRGLWVRSLSASGLAPLMSGESPVARGALHSLAWSPDSRRLAFIDGNPPSLNNRSAAPIFLVDVATKTKTLAVRSDWINLSPIWAPDGASLLYLSTREGPSDVYQQFVSRSGKPRGEPRRVTVGLNATTISLSADGAHLAYDVLRNRSNIWSVDLVPGGIASTASAKRITGENQRIESMSLSHDGKWLAFDSDRSGNFDIYKVSTSGGDPVQLTTNRGNDFAPSWSPDDRSLIFHSSRLGKREAFSIGADGADEHQLTHAAVQLYAPNYAPDGKSFVAMVADTSSATTTENDAGVFTQEANGTWSLKRRLSAGRGAFWPRWSSDGRWVTYAATEAQRHVAFSASGFQNSAGSLRIVPAAGGDSRLMFSRVYDERAVWSAWGTDPSFVFFDTIDHQSRYRFYVAPVAGGAPRLVMHDDAEHRVNRWDFATDGKRMYVSLAADESDVFVMELKHSGR